MKVTVNKSDEEIKIHWEKKGSNSTLTLKKGGSMFNEYNQLTEQQIKNKLNEEFSKKNT